MSKIKCGYSKCAQEFSTKSKNKKFCSKSCYEQYKKTPEYKNNARVKQLARIKEGTHSGWKVRPKGYKSTPEKFFKAAFDLLELDYAEEHKVGKYQIDFAFLKPKIAVEIDGKQHLAPEIQERDRRKDKELSSKGWKIVRIPWKNPKTNRRYLWHELLNIIEEIN